MNLQNESSHNVKQTEHRTRPARASESFALMPHRIAPQVASIMGPRDGPGRVRLILISFPQACNLSAAALFGRSRWGRIG